MLENAELRLVSLSGTVFVDRANRESAIAAFDAAVKEMKEKQVD